MFLKVCWRLDECLHSSPTLLKHYLAPLRGHSHGNKCRGLPKGWFSKRVVSPKNFESHWSIPISGEIHMDQSLVHTFSWGNSYGPMVLKVLQNFPPTLVLVHGWLSPEKGGFGGCSPGTKTGTRVHSYVPPERKPERGVRSHVAPERKPERKPERGYIRQNHPFTRDRPFLSQ